MGFLCVMYYYGREVDRWPNVDRLPAARFWTKDHICMTKKPSGETKWAKKISDHSWAYEFPKNIPKTLRLLALLE